jgi:anti-sigma factor ChrR (cupin superfamily)
MQIDKDGGLVIDTDAMEWRTLAPGVGIKVLRLDRATEEWTIMIRSEKGSVLPPHQHIGNSEIYIIKGAGHHQQAGHFKTGDYVLEPDGATHSSLFFEQEVIQIMFAKGPSQFLDEEGNPTFLMDVNMLGGFAEEHVLASA